ncbi:MAG: ATP-dependent Clp protease ATP-binding subunit [Clostridia bacterium]|nr:ATP-dependent Clp protease ATP-binding subunit [Clostridia bacterium]
MNALRTPEGEEEDEQKETPEDAARRIHEEAEELLKDDAIAKLLDDKPDKEGHKGDELPTLPPSDLDDLSDGGSPAIDLPKLVAQTDPESPRQSGTEADPKEQKEKKKSGREESNATPLDLDSLLDGLFEEEKKEKDEKDKKADKRRRKTPFEDEESKQSYLRDYCRCLTQSARAGSLDKIVGRRQELLRMEQILCRRQKNNPCLIGEPGVGKTAIAEALAIEIASGNVPYKLKDKEIWLVDLTALIAGTQFRGQFEGRILGLLKEVKAAGNVILVIDEVHNIVGTGNGEGSVNAANILKPALSRGEIQIIGATTLTEYRKYIEKDTALERRFQPIMVEEPSKEESVEMLRGIKHYYETFHHIRIPEEILYRCVVLSERYITDRYLPDKAIDLLDEAASKLSLSSAELNESFMIRDRLLKLKHAIEVLEADVSTEEKNEQKRYEQIARLKAEEMKQASRLQEVEKSCQEITLTVEELADVIEVWTGVPATSIKENEFQQLDGLENRLKKRIIGQDEAVHAVANAIKRNRAGVMSKRRPVSFIFAGPTGVGKTELVKTLANDLFHSPETLIRLDMSEFMEKHSVSRIIGAPPGYVGYDEAGQLTEKIRRRPYSVVLFDEIEKAHPDVLNVLLQILDDGRITDAQGRTVNFDNTVIVMTTNAGSEQSASTVGFAADARTLSEAKTEKALSSFLRPEFINRVDEIITFRSLSEDDFVSIASIMLGELKEALAEKEIDLSWTEDAARYVAHGSYSIKYGARNMRRFLQKHVEDALADRIISDYKHSIRSIRLDATKQGELSIECG